jgi:hypothetical protein
MAKNTHVSRDDNPLPDETFVEDVKQPPNELQSAEDAALTRRVSLKLDIRYIL